MKGKTIRHEKDSVSIKFAHKKINDSLSYICESERTTFIVNWGVEGRKEEEVGGGGGGVAGGMAPKGGVLRKEWVGDKMDQDVHSVMKDSNSF